MIRELYSIKQLLSPKVFILLGLMFSWIAAPLIYGAYAELARATMQLYFIIWIMFELFGGRAAGLDKDIDSPEDWRWLIFGFAITAGVLIVGSQVVGSGIIQSASLSLAVAGSLTGLSFASLHLFTKAFIEERVFRRLLPSMLSPSGKPTYVSDAISNIIFGAFHAGVLITITIPALIAAGRLAELGALNYTHAIAPVIVLMVLGMVWALMRGYGTNQRGILFSTGSHFAWNLFVQGILGLAFMGGIA